MGPVGPAVREARQADAYGHRLPRVAGLVSRRMRETSRGYLPQGQAGPLAAAVQDVRGKYFLDIGGRSRQLGDRLRDIGFRTFWVPLERLMNSAWCKLMERDMRRGAVLGVFIDGCLNDWADAQPQVIHILRSAGDRKVPCIVTSTRPLLGPGTSLPQGDGLQLAFDHCQFGSRARRRTYLFCSGIHFDDLKGLNYRCRYTRTTCSASGKRHVAHDGDVFRWPPVPPLH